MSLYVKYLSVVSTSEEPVIIIIIVNIIIPD
jgi:hypothetical protein